VRTFLSETAQFGPLLPLVFFFGGGILLYCFHPDFWFHPQFFVLEKNGDQNPPSSGYFADNSNGP
jgi:hypothetical protein